MASRRRFQRLVILALASLWAAALPSPAMAASKPTPPQNPTATIISSADGITGTARIKWQAPAGNGGYPIGSYNITVTPSVAGSPHSTGGSTTQYDMAGFTLGTTYTVAITATNTYDMTSFPNYVHFKAVARPNRPTDVAAAMLGITSGKVSMQFSWKAPAHDGGSAITQYAVTVTPVGKKCLVSGATYSCAITGFTPGAQLQAIVEAQNAKGWSAPSAPLSFEVPDVAGPPTELVADVASWQGNTATVELNWSPPSDNGGSGIQGYAVSVGNGSAKVLWGSVLSYEFAGLAPGDYTFSVIAKNGVGSGAKAEVSLTVPAPPTASPTPTEAPSTTAAASGPAQSAAPTASGQPSAPSGGSSGPDALVLLVVALAVLAAGLGGGLVFVLRRNAALGGTAGGSTSGGGAGGAA